MGAGIELFDTRGPADAGPPPHVHPWEEVYVVLSGRLEVSIAGERFELAPGGVAHIPAGVEHGYRNLGEAHFLTITTRGNAAAFFTQVASQVAMNPPDFQEVARVAASHEIAFTGLPPEQTP
ncbi:MAG TPA: cupin domain-containing protein [Polyangiales bacterium]|nr:cupin domain-containing protein [Polyangiales bacterium]